MFCAQFIRLMVPLAKHLITQLGLLVHPEGGYYRETYRSTQQIEIEDSSPNAASSKRSLATAIYFLLCGDEISALHRIKSDELWHFYTGSPLMIYIIDEQGVLTQRQLGIDTDNGEFPQITIPAGCWFGAKLKDTSSFSFVGCTVSPGFDFRDFELAHRHKLTARYPNHKEVITRLTRTSIKT